MVLPIICSTLKNISKGTGLYLHDINFSMHTNGLRQQKIISGAK
jgi:hypothetical protein